MVGSWEVVGVLRGRVHLMLVRLDSLILQTWLSIVTLTFSALALNPVPVIYT